MHTRQVVGRHGETLVTSYLKKHGYTIIATNVSWHQRGEVDIIAQKNEYLVCVEVKSRYNDQVSPFLLVPRSKQRKIIWVMRYFVQKYQLHDFVVRFDVALVNLQMDPPHIEYIRDAFQR